MSALFRLLAVVWLTAVAATGWAVEPIALPSLASRVTDLTGTLRADERAGLEGSLAAIERDKGAQVAILLLPTTQPETIEAFGMRLAEAWKVGRRGVNDGVIVIVAKDDRKMRIEVGYGLEGAIPDAIAKRIVAERMAPRFKQGDFAGGLAAAVQGLGEAIGGEALPPPSAASVGEGASNGDYAGLLFLPVVFAGVLRAFLGIAGSMVAAALAAWLAWMVFSSWIAAALAAIVAFLFSFARGGGWGGWGGGSSSSSGGGFSGGGGGFGGGGASGDW